MFLTAASAGETWVNEPLARPEAQNRPPGRTLAYSTAITSWPGPATGSARSVATSADGGPKARNRTARIAEQIIRRRARARAFAALLIRGCLRADWHRAQLGHLQVGPAAASKPAPRPRRRPPARYDTRRRTRTPPRRSTLPPTAGRPRPPWLRPRGTAA